ncbi:MAG: cupin domain-containing protein [Gemmatimonadales bacterium]
MNESISRERAPHYTWGDGCQGWHLVRTGELSVIEERMPPGTMETRHRHARARQLFYVISGTLQIEVEEVQHHLVAREGLEVPPGAAHQVMNSGPGVAEFLVISQPPSQGDREPA